MIRRPVNLFPSASKRQNLNIISSDLTQRYSFPNSIWEREGTIRVIRACPAVAVVISGEKLDVKKGNIDEVIRL